VYGLAKFTLRQKTGIGIPFLFERHNTEPFPLPRLPPVRGGLTQTTEAAVVAMEEEVCYRTSIESSPLGRKEKEESNFAVRGERHETARSFGLW
jgi:hypothetical protein